MNHVWKYLAAAMLAVTGPRWCSADSPNARDLPGSSLVVVMGRFFDGRQVGNGFVVGDGSLVVTCDHLVYERSESGGHCIEGLVSVFSPYLGQACDARILASDEELDLAVLETPWKGHPSLALGDANAVLDARSARVIGLSAVLQSLDNRDAAVPAEGFTVQEEELPVAFVGVRERVARFITLSDASLEHPEDAWEACKLAFQAASSLRPDGYESALKAVNAFIRLRPESGYGHRVHGYANEKLGRTEAARESYRRAVELAPDSLNAQLLYAQFLGAHGDLEAPEAFLRAHKALDLPPRASLPREKIEQLIADSKGKRTSTFRTNAVHAAMRDDGWKSPCRFSA